MSETPADAVVALAVLAGGCEARLRFHYYRAPQPLRVRPSHGPRYGSFALTVELEAGLQALSLQQARPPGAAAVQAAVVQAAACRGLRCRARLPRRFLLLARSAALCPAPASAAWHAARPLMPRGSGVYAHS